MIKIVKGVVVTLAATLLLTACSSKQENMNISGLATDATVSEVARHNEYINKVKKAKKRRKMLLKKQKQQQKTILSKFCFKDARSIHYRAEERCK